MGRGSEHLSQREHPAVTVPERSQRREQAPSIKLIPSYEMHLITIRCHES